MSGYRTNPGDRLPRDPVTGRDYDAARVYRAEDLPRFGCDAAWLRRADESTALMTGCGRRKGPRHGQA